MPTLTTTTTVTTAVEISPRIRKKLLENLKAFADLKAELKAIEHTMELHKVSIDILRAETGEANLALDGFRISLVSPTRSTLDVKLLLQQGVSMGQVNNATVTKPTKAYIKISIPSED